MEEEKKPELSEEELSKEELEKYQERLKKLHGDEHETIEANVKRLMELHEIERNKEIEARLQNLEKNGGKSRHKRSKRSRKTKRIRTKRSRKTKRNRR
jgi:hypothetical protein